MSAALHRVNSAFFVDGSQPGDAYRIATQEYDSNLREQTLMATADALLTQIYTVDFVVHYCNEEWPFLDAGEVSSYNRSTGELERRYPFPDHITGTDRELKKSCHLKGVLFALSKNGNLYSWNKATGEFLRHFQMPEEWILDLCIKDEHLYIKTEPRNSGSQAQAASYKKLTFAAQQ